MSMAKGKIFPIWYEDDGKIKSIGMADLGVDQERFVLPSHHGLQGQIRFSTKESQAPNFYLIIEHKRMTVGVMADAFTIMMVK